MTEPVFSSGLASSFASTYVGASSEASVTLSAGDADREFALRIDGDFSITETSLSVTANTMATLVVTFTPSVADTCSGTLTATYTDSEGDTVELMATPTGTGLDPEEPSLAGDLDELDFSTLGVGSSLDGNVVVDNPSTDPGEPCSLSIAVSGPCFSASPTGDLEIGDGSSGTIAVTFSPTQATTYDGELKIRWKRGSQETGTFEIPLRGSGTEEDVAATDDVEQSSVSDDETTLQRATLWTPSYSSLLSLGAAYSPSSTVLSQAGFTCSTTRNVFMKADKAVTFQADGLVWFQSTADVLLNVAGGSSYLVAKQDVYVGSGHYVAIMAGYNGVPSGPDSVWADPDVSPGMPSSLEAIDTSVTVSDAIWSVVDYAALTAITALEIKRKLWLEDKTTNFSGLDWPVFIAQVAGRLVSFASTFYNISQGDGDDPEKVINLFSEAGIIAGSPGYVSFNAAVSAGYRAPFVSLFGAVSVLVSSIGAVSLDSLYGETLVQSSELVTVGALDETAVDSATETVSLLGMFIDIGSDSYDGLKVPTSTHTTHAEHLVKLETTFPSTSVIAWTTEDLEMGADTKVEYEASDNTTFELGDWKIEASSSGIVINNADGEVVKVESGTITLGPESGQITLKKTEVDLGGSLTIGSSGISLDLGMVEVL